MAEITSESGGGLEELTSTVLPVRAAKVYSLAPLLTITAIWAVIAFLVPFFIPKRNPNRRITQCCILMTAVSCWIFWFTVYVAQMNPLIGPRLENLTLLWIAKTWGKPL